MFYYKFSCLILLMLSVICFSYDNPGIVRKKKKFNEYTTCMRSMTGAFGLLKQPLQCMKHAIYHMKLYGEHRSIYPMHVTLYYQEFHTNLHYEDIMLPSIYCRTTEKVLNEDCFNKLKVFEEELSQENILNDYNPKELESLLNALATLSGPTQGESSSSQSEEQPGPSVESSAIQFNFAPDELQIIQNEFPSYTQGPSEESSAMQFNFAPDELQIIQNVFPSYTQGPSEEAQLEFAHKTKQKNILKNALYYHRIVKLPEGVVLTDEMGRFFHIKDSYGYHYMMHIIKKTGLSKENQGKIIGPALFCKNLYPKQRMAPDVP